MLVHKVLPLMRKIQLPISDYFSQRNKEIALCKPFMIEKILFE